MKTISETAQEALAHKKQQSVKNTRQKLELALRRLVNNNPRVVKKNTKISAASVAKEARVNRVTLYRFHEPVLVEIRKINDTTPMSLLKESRSQLAKATPKLREYRKLVEEAQEEVIALARINYRLDAKVSELEELIKGRDELINGLHKQLNERKSKPKTMRVIQNFCS